MSTPKPPGLGESPPSREPGPRPFPSQRPRPQSSPSEQQVSPFCFQTPSASRCLVSSPNLRVGAAARWGGPEHLRGACGGWGGVGGRGGSAGTRGCRCPREPWADRGGRSDLRGGEEGGWRFQVPPPSPRQFLGAPSSAEEALAPWPGAPRACSSACNCAS